MVIQGIVESATFNFQCAVLVISKKLVFIHECNQCIFLFLLFLFLWKWHWQRHASQTTSVPSIWETLQTERCNFSSIDTIFPCSDPFWFCRDIFLSQPRCCFVNYTLVLTGEWKQLHGRNTNATDRRHALIALSPGDPLISFKD